MTEARTPYRYPAGKPGERTPPIPAPLPPVGDRCPRCGGRIIIDQDGDAVCLACGFRRTPDRVLFPAASTVVDPPKRRPRTSCPVCRKRHRGGAEAHQNKVRAD